MNFDVSLVPFSRFGSWLAVSQLGDRAGRPEGLYIRTVRGQVPRRELFRVEMLRAGQPTPCRVHATASSLTLQAEYGQVEICMPSAQVLRLRGQDAGVRLTMPDMGGMDTAMPIGEGRWEINTYESHTKLQVQALAGVVTLDAPWRPMRCERIVLELEPGADGVCEIALQEFRCAPAPADLSMGFRECVWEVQREVDKWLSTMPAAPRGFAPTRELAAYVNWSSVVSPSGLLNRPTMLMSKGHMTNCWSWDHCFNALALTDKHPQLAWDQLMTLFDRQDATGALPDSLNDAHAVWEFCKPPIHGWALKRMMERTGWIGPDQLEEIYEPLVRWTDWWFTHRDYDADGLPQYNHGNDSGWDNATVFDAGCPVEGPDLAAFLVFQMNVLAEVAGLLDRKRDQRLWQMRAYDLLGRLMEHSWRGDHFVAPISGSHEVAEGGDSLLPFMPLVLADLLPKDIRRKLISGLRRSGRFLTRHGLATESPKSRLYEDDGYWRGPIWAPSTYLLADGLRRCGQIGLAGELARRFCRLCRQGGFAENFDARTGQPLRDRAYTWTSSAFLLLASEYLVSNGKDEE